MYAAKGQHLYLLVFSLADCLSFSKHLFLILYKSYHALFVYIQISLGPVTM